jgi:Na+/pantothenate symporter
MIKILTISLGVLQFSLSDLLRHHCRLLCAAGLWAVLWTDLVQFVIKMSAVIILAVYAVNAVGGIDVMRTKLTDTSAPSLLRCP